MTYIPPQLCRDRILLARWHDPYELYPPYEECREDEDAFADEPCDDVEWVDFEEEEDE